MSAIYKPDFALQEVVQIRALREPATVVSIRIDARGFSYLLAYWMDGKRYEEYLYQDEIAAAPALPKPGEVRFVESAKLR